MSTYTPGTLVWGHTEGFPWWPAIVLPAEKAPRNVTREKPDDSPHLILIKYYDDPISYDWIRSLDDICLFRECYDKHCDSTTKARKKAVTKACEVEERIKNGLEPSDEESETADENEDECAICGDNGDLLMCDTCPKSFHLSCLSISSVPEGTWVCPSCKKKTKKFHRIDSDEEEMVEEVEEEEEFKAGKKRRHESESEEQPKKKKHLSESHKHSHKHKHKHEKHKKERKEKEKEKEKEKKKRKEREKTKKERKSKQKANEEIDKKVKKEETKENDEEMETDKVTEKEKEREKPKESREKKRETNTEIGFSRSEKEDRTKHTKRDNRTLNSKQNDRNEPTDEKKRYIPSREQLKEFGEQVNAGLANNEEATVVEALRKFARYELSFEHIFEPDLGLTKIFNTLDKHSSMKIKTPAQVLKKRMQIIAQEAISSGKYKKYKEQFKNKKAEKQKSSETDKEVKKEEAKEKKENDNDTKTTQEKYIIEINEENKIVAETTNDRKDE